MPPLPHDPACRFKMSRHFKDRMFHRGISHAWLKCVLSRLEPIRNSQIAVRVSPDFNSRTSFRHLKPVILIIRGNVLVTLFYQNENYSVRATMIIAL